MCTCITDIPKTFIDQQPLAKKNKTITNAELDIQFSISSDLDMQARTYTVAKLHIEGKEKPVSMNVTHTYCPFCGEKYKK